MEHMTLEGFSEIFDTLALPIIKNLSDNNSYIVTNDVSMCKGKIYERYLFLNQHIKRTIYEEDDEVLLDRHRVAACLCGAFISVPVFDNSKMLENIKLSGNAVEAFFYYPNELLAFAVSCRVLSLYMIAPYKDNPKLEIKILQSFPILPDRINSELGVWATILFNLSQVSKSHIGVDHFDVYAYAMLFFFLESHFDLCFSKDDAAQPSIVSMFGE